MKETLSDLAKRIDDHLKIEDPDYLLELQAKEAVKEIMMQVQSEQGSMNIGNEMNILYEGPQKEIFYEIPLSTISRTILKQHGAKEEEITVSDVTSKSKRLKDVFESNLGFGVRIGKNRSRVVLVPRRWVEAEEKPLGGLEKFLEGGDSYKDVQLDTDVHKETEKEKQKEPQKETLPYVGTVTELENLLHSLFNYGTQEVFEKLAIEKGGLTQEEVTKFFERLVDDGKLAMDPEGWWRWTKEGRRNFHKLCRECGKPRETGSQIFFECPETGQWKSPSDHCDQEAEA